MNELKNYQEILLTKAYKVEALAGNYPELAKDLKTFREINDNKVKNVEPQIMFYGIYNAGKSSILNEILGQNRATVADKPETDRVTYYDWQGYKIADTPGIFAPIKHQEVTQEHLKKADIVLFVMSTTGSNERLENYQRMKDITDAGKKIIIVLNDKNGDLGKNDEALRQIKQKVVVNMAQCGIQDVEDKYHIVTVNALRAKTGREKGKPGLIEYSNIDELKNVILNELKRTTSFDILRRAIRDIEKVLTGMSDKLKQQENSDMIRQMNVIFTTFNKQKSEMRKEINNFVDARSDALGYNLPEMIWAQRANQEAAQKILEDEIGKFSSQVEKELQRLLKETVEILQEEVESFVEMKVSAKEQNVDDFKAVLNKLSTSVNVKVNDIKPVEISSGSDVTKTLITGGAVTEALSTGATFLAKQIGGKIGTSLIPVIGPVITVVGVLYTLKNLLGGNDDTEKLMAEINQRNEQERARMEAEMQARQELRQKCFYMAENVGSELKSAVSNTIEEVLKKYEEPFKAELEKTKEKGNQVADDAFKLGEICNEYDLLRTELGK
ncbi:MAG: 50S ribosome-binding GTPase [Selenomonadaceae bacterium]|nr:50S ribosome-binding GTPase [Selenomonadaceae bacterium]